MQQTSFQQTWQSPPEPINTILDAPAEPDVILSPDRQWFVELEHPLLHPIAQLAEPEVAVAGLRINPKTNALSRQHPYHTLRIKSITGETVPVALPDDARIRFIDWSFDSKKLAFTLVQETGLELWVLSLLDGRLQRLTDPILNSTQGFPYHWLPGDEGFICKVVPVDRGDPPAPALVPAGPLVEENLGRTTANRTYTNLLKNAYDETLFEYYVTSAVVHVALDGTQTQLVAPALVSRAIPSPDGQFIMLTTWHRPFSYQVPAELFPKRVEILDRAGDVVYQVADLPLADDLSIKFDSVRPGRRYISWRSDRPSTLYWVEALDGGDAGLDVPLRDAFFELNAPFADEPKLLWKSEYRFRQVLWGTDDIALVWEQWYDTRKQRMWRLNPSESGGAPHLLIDRSFEDRYNDPGTPLAVQGAQGWRVLRFTPDNKAIYLKGRGASPAGVYPFLDRMDLDTAETERLWQAEDPYYELVVDILSDEAETLMTYRQSSNDPPNYVLRERSNSHIKPLTDYQDPAPQLAGIQREVVRYKRSDGVQLSATLYLPPGYDRDRDGPLPTVFWAYPQEFKDAEAASQVTTSQNSFSRPARSSVLFLLTQGYAVLNNPSMPILGEGDVEPNDTYIEQLIAGAEAAVEYVVGRGVADRDRLGIGGHSYGAFTTANLLAHTDLFQAGVARSGAYNRTLTPFGFQGEQRNFWEALETYTQISPFTHAAKIKKPLLLIHGASDSNAGTYPQQSERFYQALKGLGGIVRLVMLPFEDHGYYSREGVGHTLWETVQWLDRYVKQASEP